MNLGKQGKFVRAIGFSDVYNEEPKDLDFYLKDIPPKFILEAVSHLLGYSNHINNNWQDFLSKYFQKENKNEYIKVRNAIYQSMSGEDIIIITPLISLFLFEYAYDKFLKKKDNDATEKFDKKEFEINFLKAYLLLNQQYDDNRMREINKLEALPLGEQIAKLTIIHSISDIDLLNHNLFDAFKAQLIKAEFLFDFLKSTPTLHALLQEVYKYFNVNNEQEIFKHLVHLAFLCLSRNEGGININIPQDKDFEKNKFFLNTLLLGEIDEDTDFKLLREKPLYKLNETTYRVIYPLFIIEKIYKSWYFKLNECYKRLPTSHKIILGENIILKDSNFRSFYGEQFTENYLVKNVLQDIFSPKTIQFSGNDIRKKFGNIGEPDYYVRNWRDIFIFETKETFLDSRNKISNDIDKIEDDLKKKLYFSVSSKDKKTNKAILQIIRNIEKILSNSCDFDNLEKVEGSNIFSILILHDDSFNAFGINYLINNWFQYEVSKLQNKGLSTKRVFPLIIITIDTFILFRDSFISKKISLKDSLIEYSKFHLPKPVNQTFNADMLLPFSQFIYKYATKRNVNHQQNISSIQTVVKNITGLID